MNKRKGYRSGSAVAWWLRTPFTDGNGNAWAIEGAGHAGNPETRHTGIGPRPAFVLPSTLYVTDDGTITTNAPPTVPPSITIPDTINGGVQHNLSWGTSTDADGNLAGYKAERSLNGGAWTQIYQSTATSTTDTVAFGTSTVV